MSKSTGKWHFLNKDLLNQLIENIGEDIFSDTIFNIDTIETRIKHENNPKEREELIINTLNSFKDRFMRFYDFYTFPHTEIDYLKQRIKIRTIDVKVYFDNTNLLNTDADDLIITEIEDNVYEGEERNIIKLNSWEELMRIMGKKIEGHEYYCKYYHLESILTDIAIYTELRKRFSNDNATVSRLSPQQNETKTDKLKAELGKYGFFELSKVKQLSEPNKQSLIELISTNDLPYSIAMFEYLGFLKHLKAEHFTTDYKLFKAVAKWFEVAERAVKGNIYVLNEHSKENRTRYTADQQKQTVQKDYEKIK